MARRINVTIRWASPGQYGGLGGVEDDAMSVEEIAEGLAGAEVTGAGLLELYAQGQKVEVELERDGQSAKFEAWAA